MGLISSLLYYGVDRILGILVGEAGRGTSRLGNRVSVVVGTGVAWRHVQFRNRSDAVAG